jgi:hypothetical protein
MDPATPDRTAGRSAAIRVAAKADTPEALDAALQLTEIDLPRELPADYAVVEIRSAGVNPSDVRAVLGAMPHAVWPRTPGRDYAGVVVEGPRQFLGRDDTLALDSGYGAAVLDTLRPGFDSGTLRPFPVLPANIYPLARVAEAYRAVLAGAPERVVLDPALPVGGLSRAPRG